MKGSQGINVLKLEVLNKLIEKIPPVTGNFFSNSLAEVNGDSDTLKWEIEYGTTGLTPFVAPGAVAPVIGMDGVGSASAKAAFYKEKMYLDEEYLNNLRLPGTNQTYQTQERHLMRGLAKLKRRNDSRKEWMAAKMFCANGFTYTPSGANGTTVTVSYGIPTSHIVTLSGNYVWDTGSTRAPITDVYNAKEAILQDSGGLVDTVIMNSYRLKQLMLDTQIQALLAKSAFGTGDLFSRPSQVVGELLGVGPLTIYDGYYDVDTHTTAPVVGSSTTDVYLQSVADIEVGAILRFFSLTDTRVFEDATITAVTPATNYVTIATTTLSFAAGTPVRIRQKHVKNNKVLFYASNVGGSAIAEYMRAPFGMDRHYGQKVDQKPEWDPEGLYLRVQGKGLPVLYHPDGIYQLQVTA